MKRFLRSVLSLIAVVGIVLAVWPLGQNAYAWWNQRALRTAWTDQVAHQPRHLRAAPREIQSAIRNPQSAIEWPPTRLIIPGIGLDVVTVQGFDDDELRRGPGHCPTSVLPGEPGNCIIAGHRNIYGSYFYHVPDLEPGTAIKLRTPDHTYTYKALLTKNVSSMDTTVFDPAPPGSPPRLYLLTCTVPHSPDRILLIAEMDQEHAPQ